ncbi:MAG: FAD-binding oxidoreductase [Candidatus Obscuribacterales bacterium]|nr:FAD-binding oxidoreductase [Candidatus Obscuribacterales bacterium]
MSMSNKLEAAKVLQVTSLEELTKALEEASAKNLAILPGSQRDLPKDAAKQLKGKTCLFLDLSKMDHVLEHCLEDQVIKVETGISVNKLNDYLRQTKQWFPVSALDDSVSVFDVINCGEGGPLDNRYGGPRQLVLGLDVTLATGEVTKCGGRVVKNVTGYDLVKLFVGSQATLGIPTAAYLRLYALPETEKTIAWLGNDAKALVDLARRLTLSGLPLSCLELIDSHLFYDMAGADTNLVQKLGVVLHQRQVVLIARLNGHADEVAECFDEAVSLGNQLKLAGQEVDAEFAQSVWMKLSSAKSFLGAQSLDIAASWTQITKIIDKWRAEHKFLLWQARPNMSLIKLFAKDVPTSLELKESLKAFFKTHDETLAILSADFQFESILEFIGQDTSCAGQLKKELKEKFDRNGILNPLASL